MKTYLGIIWVAFLKGALSKIKIFIRLLYPFLNNLKLINRGIINIPATKLIKYDTKKPPSSYASVNWIQRIQLTI